VDKEGSNLSFRELKKLVGHYGRHLYDEGRLFAHVPLGEGNADRGQGVDEFGKTFRYKCGFPSCWKAAKGECGYKEFALHMVSDHEALEAVLEEDARPELLELLAQIRAVKARQREETQPRCCEVRGCQEADKEHVKDQNYRTLRHHYATAHWRRWFERTPREGEAPRTQKLTKTGALCQVCNLKMFGDDAKMIEHYAVVHSRLEEALVDPSVAGVGEEDRRAVAEQLFPHLLSRL